MNQVRVSKDDLLKIIRKNRDEHRDVFLEAQTKFREVVIEVLDAQLKSARNGMPVNLIHVTQLSAPEDHTADYDRAIQMLEMCVDNEITISSQEFQNYVQDIWRWSTDWAVSNLRYVSKNSRSYGKLSALSSEQ